MNRRTFLTRSATASAALLLAPSSVLAETTAVVLAAGRQLFVDDLLIAHTTLTRCFHQATYRDGPVLAPDRPWEEAGSPTACAMPFSDGVLYDPADGLFKMWYMAGMATARPTCLAVSEDATNWRKPDWGVVPGTNIVWPYDRAHGRDSHSVIRDPADPRWRFKMQSSGSGRSSSRQWLFGSPDGIHWTPLGETPECGDRTTMFFDPFRRQWVMSIRAGGDVQGPPRHRVRNISASFVPDVWAPHFWTAADERDHAVPGANGAPPQLYNLDCVAYENLLLGLFTIFRGDLNDQPKVNEICVGFSRDGFHWHRPDRRSFIGIGEAGAWNAGNVQSAGGCCVVLGDTLGFFVSGRAGVPGTADHGICSTGLATLRRDGFASMEGTGTLLTPPVVFSERHLWVNARADGGLRVEILDAAGTTSYATSAPFVGNSTRQRIDFPTLANLEAGIGVPLRLQFHLERGALYSFWISDSGRSGGYLAGGGAESDRDGRDA